MSVPAQRMINAPEVDDSSTIPYISSVTMADLNKYAVGSPEYWLAYLEKQLAGKQKRIEVYDGYYEGTQDLAFATEQFKKAFGLTFRAFADNWMAIVVDSAEERLDVEGFRIPGETKEDPTVGDAQAWDMWQANGLDAGSQMVHTDAMVDEESYVLVGPDEGSGYPRITGESPFQMTVACGPGHGSPRRAALKKWKEDNTAYATLYLPQAIYKYVSKNPLRSNTVKIDWVPRQIEGENWPLANIAGEVPVVPFPNRPRLAMPPRSEIADLIPLQNAINKLFMDMLVASEYAGFRQRWATGVEPPVDSNGQLIDVYKMALDRFVQTSNETASFGSFEATELSNYTNAIAMAIQHLASRSATPPHYFLAHMGNFPSGEALKAAETGLVSKVRRKMRVFGEAWEEVIRLGFVFAGDETKAKAAASAETIWRDPESRTESQHVDAVIKMTALGVPEEVLWEKSGYFSPQEIARMKQLKAEGAPVPPVTIPAAAAAAAEGTQPADTVTVRAGTVRA